MGKGGRIVCWLCVCGRRVGIDLISIICFLFYFYIYHYIGTVFVTVTVTAVAEYIGIYILKYMIF